MKIIGFRNSSSSLRYAILNFKDDGVEFENANGEHALKYPKGTDTTQDKLVWLHDEVSRILRKNKDVAVCALKSSEYGRSEKKANRFTSYADAIVLLACRQNGLSVEDFIYTQLPTTNAQVKVYAGETCRKKRQILGRANCGCHHRRLNFGKASQ